MFKANTGQSIMTDAKAAGIQAAGQAKEGLGDVKLAFVYASVAYDLSELLAGVASELPGAAVIGNTSFTGVVTNQGLAEGDAGFVGVMALAGDAAVGVAVADRGNDARLTGQALAREAMQGAGKDVPPAYYYLACSPGEEEFYIKGISDVIGRVPCFGGSAADNAIAGEWSLYAGDSVVSDGAAVAFVYSDQPITNLFTGAYRETADVGIITKVADNRVLVEIDGVPATQKYAAWAGVDPDTLSGMDLLVFTITSPLGVKDRLGDLTAIRHPMNGNADYSMNIGANLAEKTAIIRMEASVDELIAAAASTLTELQAKAGGPVAAYHLVHCGGRRAGIADRLGEVVTAVQAVAGDTPFIMEFTFGEYGFVDDGSNSTGGLMLSYTAIV